MIEQFCAFRCPNQQWIIAERKWQVLNCLNGFNDFLMRRSLLLCSIVLVAIAAGTAVSYELFQPYLRARNLRSQIAALQVGKSGFEQAKHVGMALGSQGNDPCLPTDCYWTFEVDNFKLPAAWRGEGIRFVAGFRVQDSIVSEQHFVLQIGTGINAQTADFWERETWPHFPKQFIVGTQSSQTFPHFRSYVNLTPATPAHVRERYLSINFNCLWKYQGCKDAEELLPTIEWK